LIQFGSLDFAPPISAPTVFATYNIAQFSSIPKSSGDAAYNAS
jgi:hypothetical protein